MHTKKSRIVLGVLLIVLLVGGFLTYRNVSAPAPILLPDSIQYKNTEYDFTFTLPLSWEGYSVLVDQWQGRMVNQTDSTEVLTGPEVFIRHPQWTTEIPRQDIPLMVFSFDQWELLQTEELAVSAAPIAPMELGRNETYVFALPARYNFAFLPGFEEVESILKNNPLSK